jgi:phosphoribosylanthranilate isomerase
LTVAVRAKICGLSTPETVDAALAGGAAFVGFMFFPTSPRAIEPDSAARLARPARGKAKIVAVTVDPNDALIDRLVTILNPDLIQLHGHETPGRAREIAGRSGVGVIKALAISTAEDLDRAAEFEGVVDFLMFDAKPPAAANRPGGLGLSFDATLLAERRFGRPWFLAGGLDPWNVTDAIGVSGAPLVDVSSGVERGPGLKDPSLIQAFLEAVRRA